MSTEPAERGESADPTVVDRWRSGLLARAPGLTLAVVIAIVATVIGRFFPIIGGPVSGVVIGVLLATFLTLNDRLKPGIKTASKFILQLSVVVLGAQLSLTQIAKVGVESLPVMLGTLVVCFLAAWLIGRLLGIVGDLRTLIGVGTGVCGASAIAAVTPVIGAVSIDVAYAISTIFVFNISAVLLFPFIGHLLGMSQHGFGLFAGTAVNDMSSVVAAASTYGDSATRFAVVVKLVRTLMIIPICIGLAWWAGRRISRQEGPVGTVDDAASLPTTRVNPLTMVPWFLIGFIIVAAINSAGLIPAAAHAPLTTVSIFLITIALSAIGLSTNIPGFKKAGPKPFLLGGVLWIVVTLTSLGLQFATRIT